MTSCKIINKPNITNIVFFSVLILGTVTLVPWYVMKFGISLAEWILFGSLVLATGLSITVGYHRLFSHCAFKAHWLVKFFSLAFGAAAFEQPALMWASLHRDHHRYVDTERDPYNINQGFWHAHMGWILFWQQEPDYSNVEDLRNDPMVMHQSDHYLLWSIGFGIALPILIGAIIGHLLGAVIISVVGRLTLVHHSTWSINSICHTFGRATYDIDATARDSWVVAILTSGEGYHNFHHRFASDYRNGVRWYHWDPSKWMIAVLSWGGLAKKLYRVSHQSILAARVAAEQKLAERDLNRQSGPVIVAHIETLREHYTKLKTALYEWERWEKEYASVCKAVSDKSQSTIEALKRNVEQHRLAFLATRRKWVNLINTNPFIPRTIRV